ncbi:hypothetical protein BDZ45DRAFT_727369 [Acephala macrosclerotiorum]|nr:hypothetical protein BDZ45DRAFT_727369 [Acephala macrosclerotiorum]
MLEVVHLARLKLVLVNSIALVLDRNSLVEVALLPIVRRQGLDVGSAVDEAASELGGKLLEVIKTMGTLGAGVEIKLNSERTGEFAVSTEGEVIDILERSVIPAERTADEGMTSVGEAES